MKIFVSLCEFLLALIDTGTLQLQQIPNLVMCPAEQQLLFPQAMSADWDTPPQSSTNSTVQLPEVKFHTVTFELPFLHLLPIPLKFCHLWQHDLARC